MSIIETPARESALVDSTHSVVVYTADDGGVTTITGRPGDSIMETAVRNGVPGIVGECGGSLSCATCHVFVAEDTLALVGGPGDLEDEMLDGTAVEREENSRLSCQIKLQGGCEYHVTTPREQL
ncbi:2Fe-2S iron-sulfur cluster-binding protein [Microbacterium rhizosphaerae]|uniref:2Fe-2S iron-sulfur cluster-binding protein n=1 Tax=Microbacterium rhizosphaerae TaxID=1678237 RepID=A0ABZ0SNP2_9MICO|nr:2Fe-2S iron-sulfur cluster-binding protein [Microbacterium rhizosphaerae]WPR90105.1 2Fe-2S iron-sulfur cluster-binding protein [Microbacterium rhizosphaerae]